MTVQSAQTDQAMMDDETAAADVLALAAAPTFAVMALLTGIPGGGAMAGMVCSPARELLRWDGMAAMYLLMSAFHLPPWLKLIARSASAP